MRIIYEGVDITDSVLVHRCNVRDTCDERCDSLDIEFENAAQWAQWAPKEDDRVRVTQDGYDSGVMYLNSVLPEDGRYRLYATSLPCAARAKAWQSFRGMTLIEIARACAAQSGMEAYLYGLDEGLKYEYLQRENEGTAAFLQRLARMEGAALKCVNGRFALIGIEAAQEIDAAQTMELSSDQPQCQYIRSGQTYSRLTVKAPHGSGTATDTAVDTGHGELTLTDLPARDDVQAGRWARALLLGCNRVCETLTMSTEFNPGLTAMARVNVEGAPETAGAWIVQEVWHDLYNLTSRVRMHRCIDTVE